MQSAQMYSRRRGPAAVDPMVIGDTDCEAQAERFGKRGWTAMLLSRLTLIVDRLGYKVSIGQVYFAGSRVSLARPEAVSWFFRSGAISPTSYGDCPRRHCEEPRYSLEQCR